MKVLAMTVGTGRTGNDIASALVFSIKNQNPDRIVFLSSEYTHEKTMPFVIESIDGYDYTEHIVDKENDVEYLFQQYVQLLKEYENEDLYIDFTSGTKAMSSAMFATAIALDAQKVSYVTGPRDKTGRVTTSNRVLSIRPEKVTAERELSKARKLFNQADYDASAKLADENIDKVEEKSSVYNLANTIKNLGKAYGCWERFEWNRASQTIRGKLKEKFGLHEYADIGLLKKQADISRKIYDSPYSKLRLLDLYLNVQRRMAQGRYDDALSRLYRAFEYMIQIELWNNFKIDTSKVMLKQMQKFDLCNATRRRLENKGNGNEDAVIKLGFQDSMELLAELGNDLGKAVVDKYWLNWKPGKSYYELKSGPLKSFLGKRNQSYLAHGTTPIDRKVPGKLSEMYYELLKQSGIGNLEEKIRTMTFVEI